jgi:MEMO1 family protein
MNEEENNPQLRPLEAFPATVHGEPMTCLRDPQGFAEQPLFLNRPQTFLVSMMDGSNSLRDIQAAFFRQTSELLPLDALRSLVNQLDEAHYLDSPAFRQFYDSLVKEFRSAPSRPACHAGSAYEAEEDSLRSQIDGFFTAAGGPGPISAPDPSKPLRGLISPHIDFHRGGPAYAHAYKALAEHPGPDCFLVFGTCHSPMEMRFALTEKDYETPLGAAVTHRDFVRALAARLGPERDYFEDEFAHRAEHSIEFQMVCLRHLFGRSQAFTVVPILVGSFHEVHASGKTAAQDPEIAGMIAAIWETIREMPGNYCMIAGADLAHVGRHFGDPTGPSTASLQSVELDDRNFLECVANGDAEGAFRFIAAEQDRRHVCGYPPIYMALRCIDHPRGELLHYQQWADQQAGAAVTFAAVALY